MAIAISLMAFVILLLRSVSVPTAPKIKRHGGIHALHHPFLFRGVIWLVSQFVAISALLVVSALFLVLISTLADI